MAPDQETDPRVDEYIDALPAWQQAICHEVRDLVHAADPEVDETIKRTRPAVLRAAGQRLRAARHEGPRQRVPLRRRIDPDPEGIITGGHDNETGRTVAVDEDEPLNAPALTAMFQQIIANNRAGGWRKLQREP